MLRRRPDNTFEYRDIERVLYASAPNTLSPERKEALRLRIFSQLGAQDEARPGLAGTARERWIAIPVGVGIAATVIAGTRYVLDQRGPAGDDSLVAVASGAVTVDGISGVPAAADQRIAATGPSWVAVGENVRVGLEDGAAFRFATSGDRLALLLESGRHHIVSNEPLLEVRGARWAARMTGPGVLEVSIHQWYTSIAAIEGEAVVQHAGSSFLLRAGDPPLLVMNGPAGDPARGAPDMSDAPGATDSEPGPGGQGGAAHGTPDDSDSDEAEAEPVPAADAGQPSAAGEQPAPEPPVTGEDGAQGSSPDAAGTPGGPPAGAPPSGVPPIEEPPVDPPPGAGHGPQGDPPGQGHAGEPPAGDPPGNPGQGSHPGQGEDPGQGQPPDSPGASGSAGPPGNPGGHPPGGPPGKAGEGQDQGRGQGTEQQAGAGDDTGEPPGQETTAPPGPPPAAGGGKASPQGEESRGGAPGQQGKT